MHLASPGWKRERQDGTQQGGYVPLVTLLLWPSWYPCVDKPALKSLSN